MNQQSRQILFIILATMIFMWWFHMNQPMDNATPPAGPATTSNPSTPLPNAVTPSLRASTNHSNKKEAAARHAMDNVPAQSVTVETDNYIATFSNQGAVLTGFQLKKYLNRHSQKPIQLINNDPSRPKPFTIDYAPIPDLNQRLFRVVGGSKKLSGSEPTAKLTFSTVDNNGLIIEKTFTFKNEGYLFDCDLTIDPTGKSVIPASELSLEWADTLGKEEITGTNARGAQAYRVVTFAGGQKDEESSKSGQENKEIPAPITWTALANQFFVAAIIPAPPDPSTVGAKAKILRDFNVYKSPTEEDPNPGVDPKNFGPRPLLVYMVPSLNPGETFKRDLRVFFGPQDFQMLESLKIGLENVVDLGMFGFIARYMLMLLKWFFSWSHSWGLSIILLSIAVKLALWFPTHNSYKQMSQLSQKTREIQPKLDALKRKYANDKQKQNEEMTKLYTEAGINPLGGCLPMFLQIPVFYALYATLSHSIELRGAHFLWASDLTLMDPYHVLPLLMGATMILQQKVSGQMANQAAGQQKFLMWFFPIFLTFFAFQWPAGLLLYWVVTNLLSMVQQRIVNREIQKAKKKDEVVKS